MRRLVVFVAAALALLGAGCATTRQVVGSSGGQVGGSAPDARPDDRRPTLGPITVPILVWHSIGTPPAGASKSDREYFVTPEQLDRELSYLEENGYHAITNDALAASRAGGAALPDTPVVLDFDDGLRSQFDHALPLLLKHRQVATFFIYTNPIGRRDEWMTWDEVRQVAAAGMAIGDHTRYHPRLDRITDPAELDAEVVGSKATLERELGAPVTAFAYPFGTFTSSTVAAVEAAGYASARGLRSGIPMTRDDRYRLKGMIATGDLAQFKAILKEK